MPVESLLDLLPRLKAKTTVKIRARIVREARVLLGESAK